MFDDKTKYENVSSGYHIRKVKRTI